MFERTERGDKMSYLMAITIGPVQMTIEESRILKDLMHGSLLISDWMGILIRHMLYSTEGYLAKGIYPSTDGIENIETGFVGVSNTFVCEIGQMASGQEDDPAATRSEEDQEGLSQWIEQQIDRTNREILSRVSGVTAEMLDEMFFIFWAVEEYDEKEESYEKIYGKLMKKLSDIKNTYPFGAMPKQNPDNHFEHRNRKCTICGKRVQAEKYWEEVLCEVCHFKRNYEGKKENKGKQGVKGEYSTYGISTKTWKKQCEQSIRASKTMTESEKESNVRSFKDTLKCMDGLLKVPEKYYDTRRLKTFIDILKKNGEDGSGGSEFSEKAFLIENGKAYLLAEYLKKLETIYRLDGIDPPKYRYCFLQLDMDDMGKFMSGAYNQSTQALRPMQEELSKTLQAFALALKRRWETRDTIKLIYAGGDDLLAVFAAEELLVVVDEIEEVYRDRIDKRINKPRRFTREITYSMSITLTGVNEDMAVALRTSRRELDRVKDRFSEVRKNGIAFNYIVNNAKRLTTHMKKYRWQEYLSLLRGYQKFLSSERPSFEYVEQIGRVMARFDEASLSGEEQEVFKNVAQYEFLRLSKRSYGTMSDLKQRYWEENSKFFKKLLDESSVSGRSGMDLENVLYAYQILEKLTDYDFVKKRGNNGCN